MAQCGAPMLSFKIYLRALRIHQWLKNLLLLAPALLAHLSPSPMIGWRLLVAVAVFCFTASAIYLINDLVDIQTDQQHPVKRFRPIAAGLIRPERALFLAISLILVTGVVAGWVLPRAFVAWWLAYLVINAAYNLGGKSIRWLDVLILTGLYLVRVAAGAAAVAVPLSPWLLAVAAAGLCSLALQKRFTQLQFYGAETNRGYTRQDRGQIARLGLLSAMATVLLVMGYALSDKAQALYTQPTILLGLAATTGAWLAWRWRAAARHARAVDPIADAARSPVSWVLLAVSLVLLYWAA